MIKLSSSDPALLKNQDQFLNLIRESRIPGAVSYHYERPSGYQAFAKTQGTDFELWEARENNQLLGFTQITFDRVNWNGLPTTIAYSGDTRVSFLARGKRISDSLIQSACAQDVPVFGAVLGSNKLVLEKKLSDWDKLGIHFREFAELKALLFRPAILKNKNHDLHCRFANSSDLPAMFFLWDRYSKKKNLTRFYQDFTAFSKSYENTPGVSLHKTLLVFDGVALVAMLSLWDQSNVRKLIVDQKNTWMNIASRFIPLPEVGEELKIIYSFQHALDESLPKSHLAFQSLISKARSISRESGAHLFSLALDSKDPLFTKIQTSALVSNSAKIILDHRGNKEFMSSNLPLHLEVGMG